MKVIFVKDLKKTAKVGDIKEVKDGYAENFLIKNGYALAYNDKNIRTITKENNIKKENEMIKKEEAEKIKKELEKIKITFKVKTGQQDRVFGTISPKQIKEELLKKGFKIDKTQIKLNEVIQSLGVHKVEIELYKEVKAILNIELVK